MPTLEARYTIDELGERAKAALATGYEPPENGQVNPLPARRNIRYYTTLGMIDRPVEMRGRKAYYGVRHLRQLVAIKRLQAKGWSLAEIQARITGLPEADLAALARVPQDVIDGGGALHKAPAFSPVGSSRGAFWRQVPDAGERGAVTAPDRTRREPAGPDGPSEAELLIGVSLEPGIWLQLEPSRPLTAQDAHELRRAAEPLLDALRARGLITQSPAGPVADKEERT
jgi:DNA-binding transcriptional MerR regulator